MDESPFVFLESKFGVQSNLIRISPDKVINENRIRWIKKGTNTCLYICMLKEGCRLGQDTHELCQADNPVAYHRYNRLFDGTFPKKLFDGPTEEGRK